MDGEQHISMPEESQVGKGLKVLHKESVALSRQNSPRLNTLQELPHFLRRIIRPDHARNRVSVPMLCSLTADNHRHHREEAVLTVLGYDTATLHK